MSKVCSTQPRPAIECPVFGWTVNTALALVVEVVHCQLNGFCLRFVSFPTQSGGQTFNGLALSVMTSDSAAGHQTFQSGGHSEILQKAVYGTSTLMGAHVRPREPETHKDIVCAPLAKASG